jgi:hypothetical protein
MACTRSGAILDPKGGEIVVFEEYFTHGFGVPVHPFLPGLCNYYEISVTWICPDLYQYSDYEQN